MTQAHVELVLLHDWQFNLELQCVGGMCLPVSLLRPMLCARAVFGCHLRRGAERDIQSF